MSLGKILCNKVYKDILFSCVFSFSGLHSGQPVPSQCQSGPRAHQMSSSQFDLACGKRLSTLVN